MARNEVAIFPGLAADIHKTVGKQGNVILGIEKRPLAYGVVTSLAV